MITIDIDPVAFYLGSIEVRWYGIIVALAVLSLALWMWRQITRNKDRIPPVDPTVAIPAIASGFGMAKLFHVIDGWDYYSQNLGEIFGGAGLSVFGGIIGVSLFFWIYSRKRHYPFWFIADLAAPGTLLAQAIGRVACTINGCCHGKFCEAAPSWLPWTIRYSTDYPLPHGYFVQPELLGQTLYPTTVYEIIFNMSLFGVLLKLRGRLKPDGALFMLYLAAYSVWRIGSGFLRAGTPYLFGLTAAQYISIAVLAFTVPALVLMMRRAKTQSDAE
ncbi:MAG: prolipoprotein diacylglyceryl transferase [Dehalococcoidales bacterium]